MQSYAPLHPMLYMVQSSSSSRSTMQPRLVPEVASHARARMRRWSVQQFQCCILLASIMILFGKMSLLYVSCTGAHKAIANDCCLDRFRCCILGLSFSIPTIHPGTTQQSFPTMHNDQREGMAMPVYGDPRSQPTLTMLCCSVVPSTFDRQCTCKWVYVYHSVCDSSAQACIVSKPALYILYP